jgi:hypothetical protein
MQHTGLSAGMSTLTRTTRRFQTFNRARSPRALRARGSRAPCFDENRVKKGPENRPLSHFGFSRIFRQIR